MNNALCFLHVVIVSEILNQATAAAMLYFKRLCKWDNVADLSSVKLFGYDAGPIEEEVSQIALFATQDIEGMYLLCKFSVICYCTIMAAFKFEANKYPKLIQYTNFMRLTINI